MPARRRFVRLIELRAGGLVIGAQAFFTSVPTANPKRLTATANRLILAPDERFLQVDLVRPAGRTLAMPVLGGLHRQYFRA